MANNQTLHRPKTQMVQRPLHNRKTTTNSDQTMKKCGEILDKKGCGSELKLESNKNSPHEAKIICEKCGFRGFKPKEKNKNKRKTSKITVKDVFEYHNQEEERCFFCRRKNHELGVNETFTIDHIQEIDKGGDDEVENTQVLCTACHKMKNHRRLYFNWHQSHTSQEK